MSTIEELYTKASTTYSDIYEHVPVHRKLTEECDSVVEIGVRSMVSTWGFIHGLKSGGKYTGIDLFMPPEETFNLAKKLAEEKGINFNFIARNDMIILPEEVGECDMLFIDSMHTYCHVTYELETFSHLAKKYITGHDVNLPWSINDDNEYNGDRSEYPQWYDKNKRGVWTAFEDFLIRHPEWSLKERKMNNHGFVILERTKSNVHGINFSIPEEKIVKEIPTKLRMESLLIPGKLETYIYETETDYYKQYQESYFAITCKKRGFDCLRHYEIIANGCIPVFLDIDSCPNNTMYLYPKDLQKEANKFYSSYHYSELDDSDFINKYNILINKFLSYMREHLTTVKVAEYVLEKSNNENKKNILFLVGLDYSDYLRCTTLHGFKTKFGNSCHDFPKLPHLYNGGSHSGLYGKEFTYSGLLDNELHLDNFDNCFLLDELIKSHYFDIVIYGSSTRGMMFYNSVLSFYKPEEIIYLNGEDESLKESSLPETNSHIFVRELV